MFLESKMGLGGHLAGRLGGHDKTKCVTRVDIRVDTFYIFLTTFTPPNKDEKKRIEPIFYHLHPPFIPHSEGYNVIFNYTAFYPKPLYLQAFPTYLGSK